MCVSGAKTRRTICRIFIKLGTYSSPVLTYGWGFDILGQGLYILFVCLFVFLFVHISVNFCKRLWTHYVWRHSSNFRVIQRTLPSRLTILLSLWTVNQSEDCEVCSRSTCALHDSSIDLRLRLRRHYSLSNSDIPLLNTLLQVALQSVLFGHSPTQYTSPSGTTGRPIRTFPSLIHFSQSTLYPDLSFHFAILHSLISVWHFFDTQRTVHRDTFL